MFKLIESRKVQLLIISVALLVLFIPVVSSNAISALHEILEKEVSSRLQSVVELKGKQFSNWLGERYNDGQTLAEDFAFVKEIDQLKRGDNNLAPDLLSRLNAFRKAYDYAAVIILDDQGRVLLQASEAHSNDEITGNTSRQISAQQGLALEHLLIYYDENKVLELNFILPLMLSTDTKPVVGYLLLQNKPEKFLIPFINDWPGEERTADLMLMHDEGEQWHIFYYSPEDLIQETYLKEPFTQSDVPTLRIKGSSYLKKDYRGEEVYVATYLLDNTGWQLVAKQDRTEIEALIFKQLGKYAIFFVVGFAALVLVLVLLWHHQQLFHKLEIIAEKNKANDILKYFYELPFIGMSIISPALGKRLHTNNYFCEMLGYSRDELEYMAWDEVIHPDDKDKSLDLFNHFHSGELDHYHTERKFIRKDGSVMDGILNIRCVRNSEGEVDYLFSTVQDVSEVKRQRERLEEAALVFEQSREAIVITDKNDHVLVANKSFTDIFGYTEAEVKGRQNLTFLSSDLLDDSWFKRRREKIKKEKMWKGEIQARHKDGSILSGWLRMTAIYNSQGQHTGYIRVFEDSTQRKKQEEHIEWLAHFDTLTQLPNRTLLIDRSHHAISQARRRGKKVALLYCDLDQFKYINDTLGHNVGDRLLAEIGQRMTAIMREEDTVSRQGGDEFIVLLYDTDADDAAHVAEKILQAVSAPVNVDSYELNVSCSIGITIYPDDGAEFDTLAKYADMAMYKAKEGGRNKYCFFTEELQVATAKAVRLENDLCHAIERDQLLLHYQPQMDISSGKIIGVEALLRWNHPELGMVPPDEFIPIAEYSGQILKIGAWVIETATEQLKRWLDEGLEPIQVSVNLSVRQLREPQLFNKLTAIIEQVGLDPHLMELELTESMLMEDEENVIEILNEISSYGIKLSIDDFGTGYSSLSYLKCLPVDCLKIDRSFIREGLNEVEDFIIARSIISLGHSLGLNVIAEGVETPEQLEILRAHDCDQAQGYLVSKPLPAAEVRQLLAEFDSIKLVSINQAQRAQRLIKLLLVTDHADEIDKMKLVTQHKEFKLLVASNNQEALDKLKVNNVALVVCSRPITGSSGGIDSFLSKAKGVSPEAVFVVLSDHKHVENLKVAKRHGALYKYIKNPWQAEVLICLLEEALHYRSMTMEIGRLTKELNNYQRTVATYRHLPARENLLEVGISSPNDTDKA